MRRCCMFQNDDEMEISIAKQMIVVLLACIRAALLVRGASVLNVRFRA